MPQLTHLGKRSLESTRIELLQHIPHSCDSEHRAMAVLVTGGTGFVGGHLVDVLVNAGHETHIVDRHTSADGRYINPDAILHVLDVRSREIQRIVADIAPDTIYHLAAQISVPMSGEEPIADADTNIIGTLNLLEAARRLKRLPKFVLISTGGAIYGDIGDAPSASEDMPCKPISPYGASKLAAESYMGVYRNLCGLPYTIVRPGNVYGPRQTPRGGAGVVAIFAKAMLANQPITIFGDGSAARDYIYVDDLVQAILTAAATEHTGPFNISSGVPTTVSQVFDALRQRIRYEMEPRYTAERATDVQGIVLDITRAKQKLGWTPTTSFDDGIALTVDSLTGPQP